MLNRLESFDSNLTLTRRKNGSYAGARRAHLAKIARALIKLLMGYVRSFSSSEKFKGRLAERFVQASYLVIVNTVQEVRISVHGLYD